MEAARKQGVKAGLLRPKVIWPFPEPRVRELAKKAKAFVVVELNYGQIYYEVERVVAGQARVSLAGHGGGTVHEPEVVVEAIVKAARVKPAAA